MWASLALLPIFTDAPQGQVRPLRAHTDPCALHLKGSGKRSTVGGKEKHKNVGVLEGCQCQGR